MRYHRADNFSQNQIWKAGIRGYCNLFYIFMRPARACCTGQGKCGSLRRSGTPRGIKAESLSTPATQTECLIASYNCITQAQHTRSHAARPAKGRAVEDALAYVEKVKATYAHSPKVFIDFLDIMKAFKTKTIDTPGVVRAVKALFAGRLELILQFNIFLPTGYKIELASDQELKLLEPELPEDSHAEDRSDGALSGRPTSGRPSSVAMVAAQAAAPARRKKKAVDVNEAIQFVNKAKVRFPHDGTVYMHFLESLQSYSTSKQ